MTDFSLSISSHLIEDNCIVIGNGYFFVFVNFIGLNSGEERALFDDICTTTKLEFLTWSNTTSLSGISSGIDDDGVVADVSVRCLVLSSLSVSSVLVAEMHTQKWVLRVNE